MSTTTDFLVNIRRIIKLHENLLKEHICREYGLSPAEAAVISFLHNNPGKDPAADIAELRMLPKGNVSQAVEGLFQKKLLHRQQDDKDRRKIHLFLTASAKPITDSMDALWHDFRSRLFFGLTDEEISLYHRVSRQINKNAYRMFNEKGDEKNE